MILGSLLINPFVISAQQNMTREERVKALEQVKAEEQKASKLNTTALPDLSEGESSLELPPLSVFLDAVTENATVKKARSQVEQIKNE